MKKNIAIIGGGLAGLASAYLLSENNNVTIYEKNKEIGLPLHCSGIITNSVLNYVKIPENIIVNKITKIKLHSKSNSTILKLKKPNIILNREKFDKFFANKAQQRGTKTLMNHQFMEYKNNNLTIKDKKTNKIKITSPDYIIGADGPGSQLNKHINKKVKIDYYKGLQAQVNIKLDNKDTVHIYFFPRGFGFLIPESKTKARIGVISQENTNKLFNTLIKKFNCKVIKKYGGLIPVYNPKLKPNKKNLFLIGDAATQVKATSFGGIIFILIAAKLLKRSIEHKHSYEKLLKNMNGELLASLFLRKTLNKFSDKDYNYLIHLIKNKKVKQILETYDRDFPLKFIFKLLITEPRFLLFTSKLL